MQRARPRAAVRPRGDGFPSPLSAALRRTRTPATDAVLIVTVASQTMDCLVRDAATRRHEPRWTIPISTSRFGIGQVMNSNRTPLGLHRIAEKIGEGMPLGTVFRARKPVGNLSAGMPDGGICHRILWLEGLEPGLNQGGDVDSKRRYIYIHGFHDESTLGHPASLGCVHVAASDLIPLFDWVPQHTLVWIQE
ncbi:MAG TPA: hypothetical protein DCM86_05210 [Verrucomicrobiales bacterium]|nr:hypothetical protein [Verrucomicrobiales bacterium]